MKRMVPYVLAVLIPVAFLLGVRQGRSGNDYNSAVRATDRVVVHERTLSGFPSLFRLIKETNTADVVRYVQAMAASILTDIAYDTARCEDKEGFVRAYDHGYWCDTMPDGTRRQNLSVMATLKTMLDGSDFLGDDSADGRLLTQLLQSYLSGAGPVNVKLEEDEERRKGGRRREFGSSAFRRPRFQ